MKQVNKVLVVGPPPWRDGGIEKHIGEIFTYLHTSHRADVVLLCPKNNGDHVQHINNYDLKIIQYHRTRMFPHLPFIWNKELLDAIQNSDIVHIHGSGEIDPFIFALLTKDVPLVVTPHFHPVASRFWLSALKIMYDKFCLHYIFTKAKRIICVSNIEKNEIIKKFGDGIGSKISVIPNGVNIDCIPHSRAHHQTGNEILFIGRLELHKNVDILIKTMPYLPKSYSLTIIGDGSQKEQLENLTLNLNLGERVNFLGNASEQEKWDGLLRCSLLVNFSSIEAFGITVVEGLACNKPILVNNKLGLLELSEKFPCSVTTVDVEVQDYCQIAAAIKDAAGKTTSEPLEGYLWKNISLKTLELYQETLRSS